VLMPVDIDSVPLDSLVDAIGSVTQDTRSGLEGGREIEGVDNATDDYLDSLASGNSSSSTRKSPEDAETQLLDALLNFGEKMRVIGNTSPLLDDNKFGYGINFDGKNTYPYS